MPNHFLVFLGGTGAKCAEALVQLAAAGAAGGADLTYHILTVDVDATNGNRKRALEAIGRYQTLREQFPASDQFVGSSLFAPRITHYDWHVQMPDVFAFSAGVDCLNAMRTQNNPDELDLMRLLYSDNEMGFNFAREGFHAIPAIGAPVLQYILREGLGMEPLESFVSVMRAEVGAQSHLILIGSIFGGTGACGVPALMRYFTDQMSSVALAGRLHTHAALLLPYYHFADPSGEEPLAVHARRFYNNARGALAFYRDMEKELRYERLYLIGSPVDYNMGAYHPGMENQQNPPTPVEWESALAIAHCVSTPIEPNEGTRQYIHSVRGAGPAGAPTSLKLAWRDFSLPVAGPVGTMMRFCAAYLGYYRQYIAKNRQRQTGVKPFFKELILPYLELIEHETQAFLVLEEFCQRFWEWARESMTHEILEQACFTERVTNTQGYPYRALNQLAQGVTAPRWTAVEDAMFDGIKPLAGEDERVEYNAGLFVHGLYAHCAP
ncbi:MAG: hypothetical protein LBB86_04690 [Oscillospiraceae bacterium]|jgi:hypothetical protein|nr:hypothetical protein [Oscillospiraceae bacterium]